MSKRVKEQCAECGRPSLTWSTVILLAILCGTGLGALYMVLAFFAGLR